MGKILFNKDIILEYFLLFFFLKCIISKKQISDSELEKIYKTIINGFSGTIGINKKLNPSAFAQLIWRTIERLYFPPFPIYPLDELTVLPLYVI